jgi:hypothetical protein
MNGSDRFCVQKRVFRCAEVDFKQSYVKKKSCTTRTCVAVQTPLIAAKIIGNSVLLVTPVGRVIQPNRSGDVVTDAHIADLIEVVRTAHNGFSDINQA